MRKLFLTLAATAALLSTGALTGGSQAMTLGAPAGMRAAIEDVAVTDQVRMVCRNWWSYGRRHHRCFWVRGRRW